MEDIEFQVLKSFLVESKSHRWIQENLLAIEAPERGGGYEAMKVLHAYNVKGGLKGALAEFNVNKNNILALLSELNTVADEVDENTTHIEGSTQVRSINSYERDENARAKCISHFGSICQICGFDFYKTYGDAALGFIEVHHIIPISSLKKSYIVDPITDLIPLCSNCYSVAHRKNPPYTMEEIKNMIAS